MVIIGPSVKRNLLNVGENTPKEMLYGVERKDLTGYIVLFSSK